MSDLISRQAVIDKINERQRKLIYCFGFKNDAVKIMDIAKSIITAISPAQPEIIRCKDCKWNKAENHKETTHWLPCRAIVTPSEFSCIYAERREDG